MNIRESHILQQLLNEKYLNQRDLSEKSGYSLGSVNKTLKNLALEGYINENNIPTPKAINEFKLKKPKNAIILAAGFGMRMIPINLSTPKAMLEVNGQPLIERVITQLHEVNIKKITIVIGFMKESFEYLIDQYGVELVVNPDYAQKNNLSSLSCVIEKLSNTYIIPSDIWCSENPFSRFETHSWYMMSDSLDPDSDIRINRKLELVKKDRQINGNKMIGISYILEEDAIELRKRIAQLSTDKSHDSDFWEIALYHGRKMLLPARVVTASQAIEINTYEQLRELDKGSVHLKSEALNVIAEVFKTSVDKIDNITVLKKGMTNRSFLFTVNDNKYIMRIPGLGTDQLIDRIQEARVFDTLKGKGLCDAPIYINPENGYKITSFLEGVRVCNPRDNSDLKQCMSLLRKFHEMKLQVKHTFDLFGQINFYESLRKGNNSVYTDYRQTKEGVFDLKPYIDSINKDWCLTHIDAVPDNFLFYQSDAGEKLQLTDWEYAGMQDPHVDIAMFCIYSMYNREQVDALIDIYFENNCTYDIRTKIYCYISICGLLWSNWCEYKSSLGVEFGEYSLRQYRFAKEYQRYAKERMKNICSKKEKENESSENA